MTIDFQNLSPWLHLLEVLVILGLWLRKPGEDAGRKIDDLGLRLDKTDAVLSSRVDVLDERVKHMPTADELTELEGTVKAVLAHMQAMQENVKGTRDAVIRIEQWMHGRSTRG